MSDTTAVIIRPDSVNKDVIGVNKDVIKTATYLLPNIYLHVNYKRGFQIIKSNHALSHMKDHNA